MIDVRVAIHSHSTVDDHVEYTISVAGAGGRSWTVSRRYQAFAQLDADMAGEVRAPVPCPLPGKRSIFASWSRASAQREEAFVRDRQTALEAYLRGILTHRDARFRESRAFADFLNVPAVGPSHPHLAGGSSSFTTSSWLEEHDALQAMVRSARADINRRDTLATRGDASGAQQAAVAAKKQLATLLARLTILARGLDDLAVATGMVEGEVRRRADMVTRLQVRPEVKNLG